MDINPEAVVGYLRQTGMLETILAQVNKQQPAVADVHRPGGEGKKPNGSKKPADDEAEGAGSDTEEVAKRIAAVDPVFAKGDAGLYVYRPLTPESAKRLEAWAKEAGISNVVPAELMHVTQVHSKKMVDGLEPLTTLIDLDEDWRFVAKLGDKGALVLFVGSKQLQDRFREAKKAGAEWDFPSYRPHVTLSYDAGKDESWIGVEPPTFPIQLGPEVFEANKETWVEDQGLRKAAGFEFVVDVKKADPDQRMIFGWASVSSVGGKTIIDKQDDIVPIEELEKGAYDFVLWSREGGDMHQERGTSRLIESLVFTPEKAAAGIVAKNDKGEQIMGWWTGFYVVNDRLWDRIKAGERPEFSIGGHAVPVEQ